MSFAHERANLPTGATARILVLDENGNVISG